MRHRNCSLILSVVLSILLIFGSAGSVFALTIPTPLPDLSKPLSNDISGAFTDADFKQAVWEWLGNTGTPGVFTQMDLLSQMDAMNHTLNISHKGIKSLNGIEYFNGLEQLHCLDNELTKLPVLPDSVQVIICTSNKITSIAEPLPKSLTELSCQKNSMTSLPKLTDKLESLYCDSNKLTSLPQLPVSLTGITCADNRLTELPALPPYLNTLICGKNKLKSLPVLPAYLFHFDCSDNQLTSLPQLPPGLGRLFCSGNYLASLPDIPSNLHMLYIQYNYLNVFSDPLLSKLAQLNITKTILPQYRIGYKGTEIKLDIFDTKKLGNSDFKVQMSSDNSVWGDANNIDLSLLTFASSNTAIAKVDSTGMVTGMSQGTASISASLLGLNTSATSVQIPVSVSSKVADGLLTLAEDADGAGSSSVDYLSASSWAVSELEAAEQLGLFTNKVKRALKQDITREEFCGIAVKLYEQLSGKQALPSVVNPFTDTSDSDILKAYEKGIVNGVSADKFAPNNKISRQEICVMITRALKAAKPGMSITVTDYARFDDESKIASWAINEVRFANKNNIMKGVGGNTIDPLGNTSREQGIILVKRTYENFQNQ